MDAGPVSEESHGTDGFPLSFVNAVAGSARISNEGQTCPVCGCQCGC